MSNYLFNSIPLSLPRKNKFNMSHYVKTTANMGEIIPILMQDILPNDSAKISVQSLVRLAPMLAPAYANIDVQFVFYFVPNRLIWKQWPTFITQSKNGRKLSEEDLPKPPRFVFTPNAFSSAARTAGKLSDLDPSTGSYTAVPPLTINSLADNLGFQCYNPNEPNSIPPNGWYSLDQMPFRAYYKIWSDYYRDENLQIDEAEDNDELYSPFDSWYEKSGEITISGNESQYVLNFMQLKYADWKKDYFTSALPFAQKGDEVLIPGQASDLYVTGNGAVPLNGLFAVQSTTSTPFTANQNIVVDRDSLDNTKGVLAFGDSNKTAITPNNDNSDPLRVSVNSIAQKLNIVSGSATEATIRDLRRAIAAQKFLERRAIGGTRYIEQNFAMFGARSSDARLQRAEFLGGYKTPVVISQLLQTSETTDNSALGTPAGNGVSAGSSYIFNKTFEEYGWLVGLMIIRPKADYMTGTPRKYLRHDMYDYYWPQFAKIGEQPIYTEELYDMPKLNQPDTLTHGTFGYTPRYAEYRFNNNRICGDFKGNLKFWTLARDFSGTPHLNAQFITCKPSNRIFAVTDDSFKHFWADLYFDFHMLRPIPKYAENL